MAADLPNSVPGLIVERRGALGLLTLDRPAALHALDEAMVDGIAAALPVFAADPAVRAVLIRSSGGKAFSAGGDIRRMHELGTTGRLDEAHAFWLREYRLNAAIHRFRKPYIALIDGIVRGGGVGGSLHGSHRLAGPNDLFAMPEVGIGFFPDVGATYALPRLAGRVGHYLAVTGARIRRADACHLGLATHSVRAGVEAPLIEALAAGAAIETILPALEEPAGEPPIRSLQPAIDRLFAADSMADILAGLESAAPVEPFAAETRAALATKSPTSMVVALAQMIRGKGLSFEAAMAMEFRIVSRLTRDPDFYEGVRALILDKDNAPRWQPADLAGIDRARIETYFAPLDPEPDFGPAAWERQP